MFLLLFFLSLPAFSFTDNSDGSRTYSKAELALIQTQYQELGKTLAQLKLDNEQQAIKIQNLETQLTIAQTLQKELQSTIETLQAQLMPLKLNLTILEKRSALNETLSAIGFTTAGISLVVNIGQAIAYNLKP